MRQKNKEKTHRRQRYVSCTTSQTPQRRLDTSHPRTAPLRAQPCHASLDANTRIRQPAGVSSLLSKMRNVSSGCSMERCLIVLLRTSGISTSSIGASSIQTSCFCLCDTNCVSDLFSFKSSFIVSSTRRTIVDGGSEQLVARMRSACLILSRRRNSDRWSNWHNKWFPRTTISSVVLNRTLAEHRSSQHLYSVL